MVVPPAPVRISSQWPLFSSVRQSRVSVNDKSDNEMKPRTVHRSPSINLTAEEKFSTALNSGQAAVE